MEQEDGTMPELPSDEPRPAAASPSATRDLLANERTLLAWVRTAVAIMALGFVVARFGLLIRELARVGVPQLPPGVSTAFGVALVLGGLMLLVLAALRYRQIADDILNNRFRWDLRLGILLTGVLVLAGILLSAYLLLTG
jgi:putative membrane protein